MVNLSELDNVSLLETFHGKVLARFLVLGKHDTSKGTYRTLVTSKKC